MAETGNIATMAERLSTELFSEFLWERVGPMNWNWQCVEERHKRRTHPSDIVFYYENPYTASRTYVNCDLKSYATGTINAGVVSAAVASLSKALACAELSPEWQQKYVHEHISADVCGLLFVYNHDGEYDKDFQKLLKEVALDTLDIPQRSKLVVLGPSDIFWLNNVRYEIVQMRGTNALPAKQHCHFFYPHLIRKKNVQIDRARAATLEMLTAPWITLAYQKQDGGKRRGRVVFFRGRGESTEEFLYLIDYLLHYQALVEDTDVQIKILDAHPNAHALFAKAIGQYIDECEGGDELKRLLDAIEFSQISQIQTRFSELQIGMEDA